MKWSVSWLLTAGMIFVLIVDVGSDKSDRYILFTLITLTLTAIYGFRLVLDGLTTSAARSHWLMPVLFFLPLVYLAVTDYRIHPYYLAYHNSLYPIERHHKLGWGEGLEQAAQWIQTQHPQASVATYYPRVFSYIYPGQVESLEHREGKDYLVLYRSMFERGVGSLESTLVNKYLSSTSPPPDHLITVNDIPYVWIYKLRQ